MRPLAPLTALLLAALAAAPARAQSDGTPADPAGFACVGTGCPNAKDAKAKGSATKDAEPPFKADAEQAKFLKPAQFELQREGVRYSGDQPALIDKDLLEKADLKVDAGKIVYKSDKQLPDPSIEPKLLVSLLDGLLPFARAKAQDPAAVGAKLREWGVPEAFNGRHLLNPDGTATYYGLMFYQGMNGKQDAVAHISGERLASAIEGFETAWDQAFNQNAADIASRDLDRSWAMLTGSRKGETPLPRMNGAAYTSPAAWRKKLEAAKGDPAAIAALQQLEHTRYESDKQLRKDPPPPPADGLKAVLSGGQLKKTAPPSQLSLAGLLAALDKLNGSPLSADQQEWLVKSFPMGETVWRMAAPSLWRQGLLGDGVKVGVIDTGVGSSPDIDPQVKDRQTFLRERGPGAIGDHATHVTGTILAIAPHAEIRSYKALPSGNWSGNPRLAQEEDENWQNIADAIDKAVADGNQVVNMSLGGMGRPTGRLAQKVDDYAKKGVVFVISAGNNGAGGPTGVGAPGNAANVITVGSVDVNDRYSRYSSMGAVWDPSTLTWLAKKIVMAPGQDIVSAAPATADTPDRHQRMDGTSMAAPHVTGLATLLTQQALQAGYKDKVATGTLVRASILESGRPMDARELPPDAPVDQDFVLVDPLAAYRAQKAYEGHGAPAAK